jgi:hypothetical protein
MIDRRSSFRLLTEGLIHLLGQCVIQPSDSSLKVAHSDRQNVSMRQPLSPFTQKDNNGRDAIFRNLEFGEVPRIETGCDGPFGFDDPVSNMRPRYRKLSSAFVSRALHQRKSELVYVARELCTLESRSDPLAIEVPDDHS